MFERPDLDPRQLVPENLRKGAIANWNGHAGRFSVYRITGYEPREGGRPKEVRQTLGSIGPDKATGKWSFKPGRSWLHSIRESSLMEEAERLGRELCEARMPRITEQGAKALSELERHGASLTDVRDQSKITYRLDHLLLVSLLSSLAGRSSALSISNYRRRFHDELSQLLPGLPEKSPSHDTIRRMFQLIKPDELEALMREQAGPLFGEALVTVGYSLFP